MSVYAIAHVSMDKTATQYADTHTSRPFTTSFGLSLPVRFSRKFPLRLYATLVFGIGLYGRGILLRTFWHGGLRRLEEQPYTLNPLLQRLEKQQSATSPLPPLLRDARPWQQQPAQKTALQNKCYDLHQRNYCTMDTVGRIRIWRPTTA